MNAMKQLLLRITNEQDKSSYRPSSANSPSEMDSNLGRSAKIQIGILFRTVKHGCAGIVKRPTPQQNGYQTRKICLLVHFVHDLYFGLQTSRNRNCSISSLWNRFRWIVSREGLSMQSLQRNLQNSIHQSLPSVDFYRMRCKTICLYHLPSPNSNSAHSREKSNFFRFLCFSILAIVQC